ncbi:hypothetical protein ABZX88_35780 [Kitasatospora aureofaciens]|uniref:hypothetical protein n=1 Tax=Kitasatospora aureofaciens TaxID=1894 RepID=UPI0033A8B2A0
MRRQEGGALLTFELPAQRLRHGRYCRPGCANTVRTDTRARLLRTRADELDHLADRLPPPVGRRLRTNADRLRAAANIHDSTAQTAEALR